MTKSLNDSKLLDATASIKKMALVDTSSLDGKHYFLNHMWFKYLSILAPEVIVYLDQIFRC